MTREEIKEFVSYIYNEIRNSNYEYINDINTEFNIVISVGEYVQSNVFKENLKLQKVSSLPGEIFGTLYNKAWGAYYKKTKRAFVYVNHLNTVAFYENRNSILTLIVFHELRHAVQYQNKDNSFMSIVCQMEDTKSNLAYLITHDNWFSEIDADIFGIKETMTFIDNHSNIYTKEDLDYLGRQLRKKRYLLRNYDYDKLFLNYSIFKLKHPEHKSNLEWEIVLFDEKGYIRSLDTILQDRRINKVDKEFIKKFVTSKVFYNSIDLNKLSEESINFLYQQYNLSLDDEIKNYESLKEKKLESKKISKYQEKSLDRLERYEKIIDILVKEMEKHKKIQRRKESLGYISVISMTIGLLIMICMFMLFVILKVRI